MIENNYSQVPTEGESSSKKKLWLISGGAILLLMIIGLVLFFVTRKDGENAEVNSAVNTTTNTVNNGGQPIEDPFPNDKDRDGIDDEEEKELGLSNLQFDTDTDGLSDVDEIEVWKTDPKKFDSDGDGFGDGYEVVNEYDPLGPGKNTP